jgi:exosortase B
MFGLLAMYGPMFYRLANSLWQAEEYAHGPIVLAVCLWLFWKSKEALIGVSRPQLVAGAPVFGFGLLCFLIGRALGINILEVGSLIPVLAGLLLMLVGWSAVRALWVVLAFLFFLVPPPGFMLDTITGTLKQQVSVIVESVLYGLGYPIARNGVVLTIGQYQMEVANACSGLNSMYSLTAIGILYLYLMHYGNWLRNGILLASLWPIAFLANILRVITLVLITYYFGDAVGQGFFHGFAGIALFSIAIGMLFLLDFVLGKLLVGKREGMTQ